jgi:peptidoglycan/LPS O-acetylase OafA/YrhL
MTDSAPTDRTYRPDIDGLRAIAILSVVLYHAGVPYVSGGFTGVDIFFVISGYLIGGHIYSELRGGTFSFARFYQRRAKRILPAFYAVLAFTILASLLMLSPLENHFFALSAFSATLSVSNIFFMRYLEGYFRVRAGFHPLLMTWSLGVEEQFYAVIPLLMLLLARIRRSLLLPAILATCILSFLLAWHEVGIDPTSAFYLLPSRAWELGIGVLLAVTQQTRKQLSLPAPLTHLLSLMGIVLMLAPILALNADSLFPGPAALPRCWAQPCSSRSLPVGSTAEFSPCRPWYLSAGYLTPGTYCTGRYSPTCTLHPTTRHRRSPRSSPSWYLCWRPYSPITSSSSRSGDLRADLARCSFAMPRLVLFCWRCAVRSG